MFTITAQNTVIILQYICIIHRHCFIHMYIYVCVSVPVCALKYTIVIRSHIGQHLPGEASFVTETQLLEISHNIHQDPYVCMRCK